MSETPLKVFIVDDESVARRRLARMIEASKELALIGEAGDGIEALKAINELRPDIVFLDVEMPELSGMEVARQLRNTGPLTVFVTAHDRFAVDAFALDAVDYLLKPYDETRFTAMLERVLRRIRMQRPEAPVPARERLVALKRGEVRLIPVASIETIEAADNYVEAGLSGGARYLVRETIETLASELPAPFVRISRSAILRSDRIIAARGVGHGDMELELADGRIFRLSRRYRQALARAQPELMRR